VKTKNEEFVSCIPSGYGSGSVVPSKLDPEENRGFGYVTIDKKKRSEVQRLLRERLGPQITMQKPKENNRDIDREKEKMEEEKKGCKTPSAAKPDTGKPSRLQAGPTKSKKRIVFDSDDDEEDENKGENARILSVTETQEKEEEEEEEEEESTHAREKKRRKHQDSHHAERMREERVTAHSSCGANDEGIKGNGRGKRQRDDEERESTRNEKEECHDGSRAATNGRKKHKEVDDDDNNKERRKDRRKSKSKEKTSGQEYEQGHAVSSSTSVVRGNDKKDKKKECLQEKEEEGVPSSTKEGERKEKEEECVAPVMDEELRRQKDLLFSMFPSITPRTSSSEHPLIIKRFDPLTATKSASSTSKVDPEKQKQDEDNTSVEKEARGEKQGTPKEKEKKTLAPLVAKPTKIEVNLAFKDVFREQPTTLLEAAPTESTWMQSLLGNEEDKNKKTEETAKEEVTESLTAPKWMDSLFGPTEEIKKQATLVVDTKLVEVPLFWRRVSEKEMLEKWNENKSWYAWDLKSKHRRVLRAREQNEMN